MIDQPRRDHVGDHAVLHENDQKRVDHLGFVGRRQPSAQDERSHIRERDLADQLLVQVIAAHEDAMQLRIADARDDLYWFRHFLTPPVKNCCAMRY